jgi:hypothetical protein
MNLQSEKANEGLLLTCAKLSHMKVEILKAQLKTINWEKEISKLKLHKTIWFVFLLIMFSIFLGVLIFSMVQRDLKISTVLFVTIVGGLVLGGAMFSAATNKYDVFILLREMLN